ncbi:LysR family transcriptional regulator [Kingella oralis]|uniref:LysR family transcriptional regulator n=1 Tax=Kingella oralis TaxID=505 RepID=UPI002D7E5145|nr:LysR family transcriptional regulator [Kingella oralis]
MNNRFEALKIFVSLAETLQFKETAARLAVSAPVVSRVIAELEDYLGEPLFQRNTRQVRLTDFGADFLPQAQQLLADSERLFVPAKARQADEMAGVVRITVPDLPDEEHLFGELLRRLVSYPELLIDWRKDAANLNTVEHQIDLGIRIGEPADNRFIIKKVGSVREKIIAAPELVARLGEPQNWVDLQQRYPLAAVVNAGSGRTQSWYLNEQYQFTPPRPVVLSNDLSTQLQSAQAARAAVLLLEWRCAEALVCGEVMELLSDLPRKDWPVYVYRPQRVVTPLRIKIVFDVLAEILANKLTTGEKAA